MLFKEYEQVESLRFKFLAAQKRRPDQFTVNSLQFWWGKFLEWDRSKSVNRSRTSSRKITQNIISPTRPLQVVYDANYLSLLVEDKEKCLDTIEYLQKQQGGSQSSQCPTTRKGFLRIVGEKVNSIDFYTSKYNRLIEEVPHSCSLISLVAYYFCARNLFHSVGSRCFQHICACFRILHYCTKYLSKDKYTMHKTV